MLTDEIRDPDPHGVPVRGTRPSGRDETATGRPHPARTTHRLRRVRPPTGGPGMPRTDDEPRGRAT